MPNTLTTEQAMDLLKEGSTVRGTNWAENEFIHYTGADGVIDERGQEVSASTLLVTSEWIQVQ